MCRLSKVLKIVILEKRGSLASTNKLPSIRYFLAIEAIKSCFDVWNGEREREREREKAVHSGQRRP